MKLKKGRKIVDVPHGLEAEALEAHAKGGEVLEKFVERIEAKKGGMLKRKDGSYSRRGLWDNIRANRGSGRKPTKEMLKQEAKIRAKQAAGGTVFKGYVTKQPMGKAVPWHTSTIMAEGGEVDDWKVTYDPANPGVYETMPVLSDKKRAKILQNNPNAIFEEFQPAEKTAAPTLSKEELDVLKSNLFNKYYGQVTSDSEGRGYDYFSRLPEFQNIPDKDKGDLIRRMSSYLQQPSNLYTTPEESTSYSTGYYREPVPMNSDLTPRRLAGYGESEAYGKGGYTVKRSSARKGKTHVVIGPDGTKKYFGDSKLGQHPKDPARKKAFYARHAKNLKGNPYFRAFARATWADGGKLTDNMYDRGIMPYDFGGPVHHNPSVYGISPSHSTAMRVGYETNLNPDGTIDVPYGFGTLAYNEQMGLGGLFGKVKEGVGNFFKRNKPGELARDTALFGGDLFMSSLGSVTGVQALKDVVKDKNYHTAAFDKASNVAGGIGDIADTAFNFIPGLNVIAGGVQGVGGLANKAFKIDQKFADPREHQSQFEKIAGGVKQVGDIAGMIYNPGAALGSLGNVANVFGKIGQGAGLANMAVGAAQGEGFNPLQALMMANGVSGGNLLGGGSGYGVHSKHGGYVHMADGGQTGLVPINVEGADFSEGSGPDAKKGELLVLNGKVIKNYVGRPPHPAEGQNPLGNDDAAEGLIVIPKARTKEYLEASLEKRKQIERSLVSQQQDREMRKSRKMGDGGYYSFGMGDQGMAYGGPIGNQDTVRSLEEWGGPSAYAKGGWIKKVTASIKRRGTEGVCTGSKFGSSSCPPGSRRYNLAKTFRAMAKRRKHEDGGFIDPVTGSHTVMYKEGGPTIHDFPIRRLKYGGDENAVVAPEQMSAAGVYPALGNFWDPTLTGVSSYNYYDPYAENADPSMIGWYGYKNGNPEAITDPNWLNILNQTYRGGQAYGGNQPPVTTPPVASNRTSGPNLGGSGPFGASVPGAAGAANPTGPGSYSQNPTYSTSLYQDNYMSSRPNYPTTGGSSGWDVNDAIKAYGILGGAYGLAQMGEGFLSKPELYKRMSLSRQRPELLNPREALADVGRTMAGYKYAGRQTGPNQRLYLTNLSAKDAAARAGIYGQYDNANAQIMNAYKDALVRDQMALMQQNQVAQMFDAQSKAARRNTIRQGASDITNTAGNVANMLSQRDYLNKIASAGNWG